MANKQGHVIENFKTIGEQISNRKKIPFVVDLLNAKVLSLSEWLHKQPLRKQSSVSTYNRRLAKIFKSHEQLLEEIEKMKSERKTDKEIAEHCNSFLEDLEDELTSRGLIALLAWHNQMTESDLKPVAMREEKARAYNQTKQNRYYANIKRKREELKEEGYDVRNAYSMRDLNEIFDKGEKKPTQEEAPKEEAPKIDTATLKNKVNNSIRKDERASFLNELSNCTTEEELQAIESRINERIESYKNPSIRIEGSSIKEEPTFEQQKESLKEAIESSNLSQDVKDTMKSQVKDYSKEVFLKIKESINAKLHNQPMIYPISQEGKTIFLEGEKAKQKLEEDRRGNMEIILNNSSLSQSQKDELLQMANNGKDYWDMCAVVLKYQKWTKQK